MELLLLPDDELLAVLHYLDVRSLLTCRLVCKRLGALALSGEVWRYRIIQLWPQDDYEDEDGAVCARERSVLPRLPPRLGHLRLQLDGATLRALTSTDCAAAHLILDDVRFDFRHPVYAQVVARQEELGRLRHLQLICNCNPGCDVCDELVAALATCSRLESLTVRANFGSTRLSAGAPTPTSLFPSLKRFSCSPTDGTMQFIRAMLVEHSATLEDVELWNPYYTGSRGELVRLLDALPRLKSLSLDSFIPGLQSLPTCGALRTLYVDDDGSGEGFTSLVELLRRAKQLSDVELGFRWSGEEVEVLEALASPALERLEVRFLSLPSSLQPLLRALPSFPALRHLSLRRDSFDYHIPLKVTRDLLRGITPTVAPALRVLGLPHCPHIWIHDDAVRTALIVNSSLRIELPDGASCRLGIRRCAPCDMGCHEDILEEAVSSLGFKKISLHLNGNEVATKIYNYN